MKRTFCLLAGSLFWACGDLHTGGFETTDLQARVVRPDGTPALGARAWLVRSQGLNGPALALDSGLTDSQGLVRFHAIEGSSADLGVDALLGDSMAVFPEGFRSQTEARVVLRPSRTITFPADSTHTTAAFLPGSHFSASSASAQEARLTLPEGRWEIAIQRDQASVLLRSVTLTRDSIAAPTWVDSLDTSNRAQLLPGPDIRLDSFYLLNSGWRVVGIAPPSWHLSPIIPSQSLAPTALGDTLLLDSRIRKFLSLSGDSVVAAPGYFLDSDTLPEIGCIALQVLHARSAMGDSQFHLDISLNSPAASGAHLSLKGRLGSSHPDSSRLHATGTAVDSNDRDTLSAAQRLDFSILYLYWSPSQILAWTDAGYLGAVVDHSSSLRRLVLHYSQFVPDPSRDGPVIRLLRPRLYLPLTAPP